MRIVKYCRECQGIWILNADTEESFNKHKPRFLVDFEVHKEFHTMWDAVWEVKKMVRELEAL